MSPAVEANIEHSTNLSVSLCTGLLGDKSSSSTSKELANASPFSSTRALGCPCGTIELDPRNEFAEWQRLGFDGSFSEIGSLSGESRRG